jgi:hypothetical protein
MTFAFGSFTLGAALLVSAFKNQSLISLILGQPGTPISAQGNSQPSVSGTTGVGGGTNAPGSTDVTGGKQTQFNGHPKNVKPGVSAVVAAIQHQFPQLVVTATTDGVHVTNSLHYQGRAEDLAASSSIMNQAAKWILQNFGSQLAEGIHNPGLSIKNGKTVPSSFWGAVTWQAHRNHIHVAV